MHWCLQSCPRCASAGALDVLPARHNAFEPLEAPQLLYPLGGGAEAPAALVRLLVELVDLLLQGLLAVELLQRLGQERREPVLHRRLVVPRPFAPEPRRLVLLVLSVEVLEKPVGDLDNLGAAAEHHGDLRLAALPDAHEGDEARVEVDDQPEGVLPPGVQQRERVADVLPDQRPPTVLHHPPLEVVEVLLRGDVSLVGQDAGVGAGGAREEGGAARGGGQCLEGGDASRSP